MHLDFVQITAPDAVRPAFNPPFQVFIIRQLISVTPSGPLCKKHQESQWTRSLKWAMVMVATRT